MVENLPQVLRPTRWQAIEGSSGELLLSGRILEPRPIDGDIIGDFEAVETNLDYKWFFEKHALFDSSFTVTSKPPTADDYKDVRDVLRLAFTLRAKADEKALTPKALREIENGRFFQPVEIDEGTGEPIGASFCFELHGKSYTRELAHLLEKMSRDALEARIFEAIPNSLEIREQQGRRCLICRGDLEAIIDEDANEWAGGLSDLLFHAHMAGVSTTAVHGRPLQVATSGLSALWLACLNKMSHSRVQLCEACGRPILVSGERGTPRKYCSDACREWKHKNPGKTRGIRSRL